MFRLWVLTNVWTAKFAEEFAFWSVIIHSLSLCIILSITVSIGSDFLLQQIHICILTMALWKMLKMKTEAPFGPWLISLGEVGLILMLPAFVSDFNPAQSLCVRNFQLYPCNNYSHSYLLFQFKSYHNQDIVSKVSLYIELLYDGFGFIFPNSWISASSDCMWNQLFCRRRVNFTFTVSLCHLFLLHAGICSWFSLSWRSGTSHWQWVRLHANLHRKQQNLWLSILRGSKHISCQIPQYCSAYGDEIPYMNHI